MRQGTWRFPWTGRAAAVLLAAGALLAALCAAPAAHAAAARALADSIISQATPEQQAAQMSDIAKLHARYLRMELSWRLGEPEAGVYDEAYFANLDRIVDLAGAADIKMVFSFLWVPQWASDSSLWQKPPVGLATGYQPFYAPLDSSLDQFQTFCQYAATRYKGRVFAYECWNEPNLWPFLYPQRTSDDDDYGVDHYFRLLRRCYEGVKAGDPDALVIAGATGPVGFDDALRTSPQLFAKKLKDLGAGAYMDAYSHHPYVPGGTRDMRPEAKPQNPDSTVSLSNIGTLLDIFSSKPFYLTEYGYNTAESAMFSTVPVSQITQADYLRRAYRMAGRHPQIKALFWYLRKDGSPSGRGDDDRGVFTGLRTVKNAKKRAWFAFAGGMRLTVSAPSSVRRGSYAKLAGALTCSRLATATGNGGVSGKGLVVQRRLSTGAWTILKTVRTRSGGSYTTWVKMLSKGRLRLAWQGVVASPSRLVAVR